MAQNCWWKAAFLGFGVAAAAFGVGIGCAKGGKPLLDNAGDMFKKHMPNFNFSRWTVSASDHAAPHGTTARVPGLRYDA